MATILVDVDGPVANLPEAWLMRYNQDYNDCLTVDQIDSWDMVRYVKSECGSAIYSYLDSHIYDFVKPVKGALEGVQELRKAGHRVIFVTSSPEGTGDAKYAWLKRHGFLDARGAYGDGRVSDDYIEAHDKSLIRGDVLIDDREENVQNFPGNTILFDAPHNRSYEHIRRAFSWDDVLIFARLIFASSPMPKIKVAQGVIAGVGTDEPVDISPNGAKQRMIEICISNIVPDVIVTCPPSLSQTLVRVRMGNTQDAGNVQPR